MKKIISTVVCFMIMFFIFYNSSQNGIISEEKSHNLLYDIKKQIRVLKASTNSTINLNGVHKNSKDYVRDEKFNMFLRKNAHFFEYFILACFIAALLFSFNLKGRQAIIYILFFCLFYAVTDEFHQMFIPGRNSSVSDIIVDFTGSISGASIFYILYYKVYIRLNKKMKKQS